MNGFLEHAAIWRNPAFVRFSRSRLRLRKSIFWYLVVLIVTSFVIALPYILSTNSGSPPMSAARGVWIELLVIQGLILMGKGTGNVASGLIQDRIDQTLDYQRLAPLSPLRSLIGYLFGLPVLEYAMFALTLPHLAFIATVGRIPLATLGSVYLVFFVCVCLYHTIGIAAGMVMRRWILGYLLAIFLVLTVNVILPLFISQLGLKFFQYLSIWPVVSQKVFPVVVPESAMVSVMAQNPYLSLAAEVSFFNWKLSPFVFTLLLQFSLIATFGIMALRRWKSDSRHLLSKRFAIAFFIAFVIVLIGNVWPAITGQFMPFALFGETDLAEVGPAVAVAFPIVFALVVWMLVMFLFCIIVPDHHSYVRGVRRAAKNGLPAPAAWSDDAGCALSTALFMALAGLAYAVLYVELNESGLLAVVDQSLSSVWRLPFASLLAILYTYLLLQTLQIRPSVMVVLLVWLLPILAAIVYSASVQGVGTVQVVLASLSPLAFVLMAGLHPLAEAMPQGFPGEFSTLTTGFVTGAVFLGTQIVALALRWRRTRRALIAGARQAAPSALAEPVSVAVASAT